MTRRLLDWIARGFPDPDATRAFLHDAALDARARFGRRGDWRVIRLALRDLVAIRWRGPFPVSAPSRRAAPWRFRFDQITGPLTTGTRRLWRQPVHTATALTTLALGIGATTAVFGVAWHVALKPLPYRDSERLVEVWETVARTGQHNLTMPAKFHDVHRDATAFAAVAAYGAIPTTVDLTGAGDPEQLTVRRVTGEYFAVFDLAPRLGRTLVSDDMDAGGVVLSEAFWRRRFAGDAAVIGQRLALDGEPAVVVGVMPDAFAEAAGRVDLWSLMALPPETVRQTGHYLRVAARLAPGVPLSAADAEVRAIAERAAATYPDTDGRFRARVEPLAAGRTSDAARATLLLIALAAAAVWLMACANLAGLQLAQGLSRTAEFGIRLALGATRAHLLGQLVIESLPLALAGAAAGLCVGHACTGVLSRIRPAAMPESAFAPPDAAVIGFAAILALLSVIVFALGPAFRLSGAAARWLRPRGATDDHATARLRQGLVTAEVAAAVTLLSTTALLFGSFLAVGRVDPGFRPDGVVVFDATPSRDQDALRPPDARRFFTEILTSVAAVPGVTSVCAINELPFDEPFAMTYVPEGRTSSLVALPRVMTSGCVPTFGLRLLRGRVPADHEARRVALVSEAFAAAAWPGGQPVGQRIHEGVPTGALIEVVGVVADTRQTTLEQAPAPVVFELWTAGAAFTPARVAARVDGPAAAAFDLVRAAVRRVAPAVPVARLRALTDAREHTRASRRFDLTLVAAFAGIALALSIVGVYGLMTQVVEQRRREIGLRVALGASPPAITRMVLAYAGRPLVIGLPGGILLSIWAARLSRRFLFGVSAADPRVYAVAAVLVTLAVLAALWWPARRARRVDPIEALRRTG